MPLRGGPVVELLKSVAVYPKSMRNCLICVELLVVVRGLRGSGGQMKKVTPLECSPFFGSLVMLVHQKTV